VWWLQTEEGDATSVRVFDDSTLPVNVSAGRRPTRWGTMSTAPATRRCCGTVGGGSRG
jgi:hypothetical protein